MRAALLAARRLFAERRDAIEGLAAPLREETETMSSNSASWIAKLPPGKELMARAEVRAEARRRDEGRQAELVELFELRVGRRMTGVERETIDAQLAAHGRRALARAVLDHDADGLAAWLAEHAR